MARISFADVVHQSVVFSKDSPTERLLLQLIDTAWMQRLRAISQTANTRLVYMFSEHSRFGHSLGVAYLALRVMETLERYNRHAVEPYRTAVAAAALLHDIGHLAPGSHTAFKCFFPDQKDSHEEIGVRIVREDPQLYSLLRSFSLDLPELVIKILQESSDLPAWTWQILSGGGWNVDRGNWCIADSILAGVSYGRYNIPALTESLFIDDSGNLVLSENRLDALMHFAVSRHAMYRQVYHHRVLLAADCLLLALVRRARETLKSLPFCDSAMQEVLTTTDPRTLSLPTIFQMRDAWWSYHLMQWRFSSDAVLADLSLRITDRKLLKTVRVKDDEDAETLFKEAQDAVLASGFSPDYYLHTVTTHDTTKSERRRQLLVKTEAGSLLPASLLDPLFEALSHTALKRWLVMPEEAKTLLKRIR